MASQLKKKRVAVIATGWVGDTIACTSAATSLSEAECQVTFFTRWPQLKEILQNDVRFKVRVYWHLKIIQWLKPFLNLWFDQVVWEPSRWGYREPFTSEIRRLAGCTTHPEYELFLSPGKRNAHQHNNARPIIAVGRDLYKRAYGRNVDEFIAMLSENAQIVWVGLDPHKNSKHGKNQSLLKEAKKIASCDLFIGPEGGLLWLAAGIGIPCLYFTENIVEVAKQNHLSSLDHVLGSQNHFPRQLKYRALEPYCSNQMALESVRLTLNHIQKSSESNSCI